MVSQKLKSKFHTGIAFSAALNLVVAAVSQDTAVAAVNQAPLNSNADSLNEKIADSDKKLHDWQLAPYDFCDVNAVHERFQKLSEINGAKLDAERKFGQRQTVKEAVQSAVKILAAEGNLQVDTPIETNYEAAMNRGDRPAAAAMLSKMTPWEQSHEAEREHRMSDAVALLIPLADKGDVAAQRRIGLLNTWDWEMKSPIPVPWLLHDTALAFKYYRVAAENGDEISQMWLGNLYSCGSGTRKNLVNAYAWYSLSLAKRLASVRKNDTWEITSKRDFITTEMSRADVQRAKHLLIKCFKSGYKNCD